MRRGFSSIISLSFVFTVLLAACGETSAPTDASKTGEKTSEVKQVLEWYAGPEFGGQYEAYLKGYYKNGGLSVTIQQGGANISYIQLVAYGQAQFGIAQAYEILQARDQGIPLVGVAAIFQKSPQALMYHADTKFDDYSDLNGKTVIVSPGAAYWEYIKKKYNIRAKEVAYNGTLNAFLADKNAVQQCYATNEPYYAKKEGFDVKYKLNSDSGFNPYPDVIFTTEQYIKEHPDIVRAFVEASIKGWEDYNKSPDQTNVFMKTINKELDLEGAKYAWEVQTPLITGGDAVEHGIGYMTEQRWKELYDAMKSVGLLQTNFDVKRVFTTEFLPKK